MLRLVDRKFRKARIWSNKEIRRICSAFGGKIVNVSGWKDADKEGNRYRDYFPYAKEYWITNYESSARGFQGDLENEIFLDLTQPLSNDLVGDFDVVFNHTVMEHIFEINIAFANLCRMTKDIVIVVVPFMQEEHADYGDFWRFTPQALERLFNLNEMSTLYLSYNEDADASIYVFGVASKHPERWSHIVSLPGNKVNYIQDGSPKPGINIIRNSFLYRLLRRFRRG